jgi:hypothetical protein
MWSFVPRIPTRVAYDTRLFKGVIHSIDELLKELKTVRTEIRGQLVLNAPESASIFDTNYRVVADTTSVAISFNNPTELETILSIVTMKGYSPKLISKIYIYNQGYFVA